MISQFLIIIILNAYWKKGVAFIQKFLVNLTNNYKEWQVTHWIKFEDVIFFTVQYKSFSNFCLVIIFSLLVCHLNN